MIEEAAIEHIDERPQQGNDKCQQLRSLHPSIGDEREEEQEDKHIEED
jgi:hypothetical protein